MSGVSGVLQIIMPESTAVYVASAVLLATFATGWAVFDAQASGFTILPVLQMLFFFVWPVGAVIYLLYRSGIRGLFTAMIHGIGLYLTLLAAFYTTFYGLYSAGMLDERFYQ